MGLSLRLATMEDVETIARLQQRAITILQKGFLTTAQIDASQASMGLDTQLIEDGTYFCVMDGDAMAGCGGWSYRATLYGNDDSQGRSDRVLDPETERARIRAMYTDPDHTRKGVGRLIIDAAEDAARDRGFKAMEMAATLSGEPFYTRCGYAVESRWDDERGAVPVPLLTMVKPLI